MPQYMSKTNRYAAIKSNWFVIHSKRRKAAAMVIKALEAIYVTTPTNYRLDTCETGLSIYILLIVLSHKKVHCLFPQKIISKYD